jgi:O-antigen/teichoic acid export membrane protein
MDRIVGWSTNICFASLALLGPDLVCVLLGQDSPTAYHIVWIVSAALAVDVSYHGVVQVLFARGMQGRITKFTRIELATNLGATAVFVALFGPTGSALA